MCQLRLYLCPKVGDVQLRDDSETVRYRPGHRSQVSPHKAERDGVVLNGLSSQIPSL